MLIASKIASRAAKYGNLDASTIKRNITKSIQDANAEIIKKVGTSFDNSTSAI